MAKIRLAKKRVAKKRVAGAGRRAVLAILGVTVWVVLALAHAQNTATPQNVNTKIQIHVIDGRTGNPIPYQHVLIFVTNDLHYPEASLINQTTDGRGIVDISTDYRYIQVFVDWHVLCVKHPNQIDYATSVVANKGVRSSDSCGKVEVNLQPGDLYIFARPRHWWEPTSRNSPLGSKVRNRTTLLTSFVSILD